MTEQTNAVFLQKIFFENWAQYEILDFEFPTNDKIDEPYPIIYFIGRNGSGKTRFFQGIKFAIFGLPVFTSVDEDFNIFDLFPIAKKKMIREELINGNSVENQTMILSLTFKEIGDYPRFHKINRSFVFSEFELKGDDNEILYSNKVIPSFSYKYKDQLDWEEMDVKDFDALVDKWFPIEVRDFYFFDGEQLYALMLKKEMFKKGYRLQDRILRKSDHHHIEEVLSKLTEIEKRFNSSAKMKEKKSKKVTKTESSLEVSSRIQDLMEKKNNELKSKKNALEGEAAKLNESLTKLGITTESLEERGKQKRKLTAIKEQETKFNEKYENLGQLLGNNTEKIYNFQWLLISDIVKTVYDDLNTRYLNKEIPTKLDKGIYDIILRRHYCICSDTPLSESQEERIKSERNTAIDENLNDEARRFLNVLTDVNEKSAEEKKDILELRNECITELTALGALGDKPAENKDEEEEFKTYIVLEKKLDKNQKAYEKVTEDLESQESKLKIQIANTNKLNKNFLKSKQKAGEIKNDDLYELATRTVKNKLKEFQDLLNERIINTVKVNTNRTFLEIIEPKNFYDRIYIDDDWNFGYYMKSNPNQPVKGEHGPSRGQFHMMGIAFLHSISGISQVKIPIFFDTPLGRIDQLHKKNIGQNITRLFDGTQVILFLTGSEANNLIDYIKGKNGWKIENPSNVCATIDAISSDEDSIKDIIEETKKDDKLIMNEEG